MHSCRSFKFVFRSFHLLNMYVLKRIIQDLMLNKSYCSAQILLSQPESAFVTMDQRKFLNQINYVHPYVRYLEGRGFVYIKDEIYINLYKRRKRV